MSWCPEFRRTHVLTTHLCSNHNTCNLSSAMDRNPKMTQKSTREKKRSAEPDLSQAVAEKRRKQNRLSQREHRKKQTAYLQNIESFIEVVRGNNKASDEEDRYSRLLKAHMELIEDNRRLRDTVSAMRRKLLNLVDQLESPGMHLR